jgi:N-acetylneuraminate synthase/N,N'-diacetyllegionaminate synthase
MSYFSQSFSIGHRRVGIDAPVFIVAEAGVSHFGSLEKAKRLVDLAVSSGADAVKFQIFKTGELISHESEDWIDRLRSKELPFEAFKEIQDYCKGQDILFFATAHDEPSLAYLEALDVPVYKIGSGEVENWPFLAKVASKKRPVILSTGMYSMAMVERALKVFKDTGNPEVAVLHCVTQYPTPPSEVNLRVIETIRETFHIITGYSDHTQGHHFPLAAAALGAKIIEKHITLEFDIPNAQDWKVSCSHHDLPVMIQQIREIEKGMGSGIKTVSQGEHKSLLWARKSLVAAVDIPADRVIERSMLCTKRPGTGISPASLEDVIGKISKVNIEKDTLLRWEQIK